MSQLEHLLNVQNELGEGPVWNVQQQALYWLDIKQSHLFKYFPASNEVRRFDVQPALTAFGFCTDGRLITAGLGGLAFWDEATGQFDMIGHPEADKPARRFNDGAVDPAGRFWAGTMNEADGANPVHSLYRVDPDRSVHKILDDVMLSNGIGWSPDRKIMYFSDTGRRQILKYDYDVSSGAISNCQIYVDFLQQDGSPDGLTVDSEGCVWCAMWDGGKVIRFSPTGERLLEVPVPARRVTSCAFGGERLNELYITTAHFALSAEERGRQPLAGDLFRLKTDTTGQVEPLFAGS
jgi:sugar lactone lactonase YvrE